MLVLTRLPLEEIVIDGHIVVSVVSLANGKVKLGITAPDSMRVDRREIHEKRIQGNIKRQQQSVERPTVAEGTAAA